MYFILWECLHTCICTVCMQYLWTPKEGIRPIRTGVIGSYVLGTERGASILNCRASLHLHVLCVLKLCLSMFSQQGILMTYLFVPFLAAVYVHLLEDSVCACPLLALLAFSRNCDSCNRIPLMFLSMALSWLLTISVICIVACFLQWCHVFFPGQKPYIYKHLFLTWCLVPFSHTVTINWLGLLCPKQKENSPYKHRTD